MRIAVLLTLLASAAAWAQPCPTERASVPHSVSAIGENRSIVAAASLDAQGATMTVAFFEANLQAHANAVTLAQPARRIDRVLPAGDRFAIFYERDTRLLMRLVSADGVVDSERTVAINTTASNQGPNFAIDADPSRNGFVVLCPTSATSGLVLRRVNQSGGVDVVDAHVTSDAGPYAALSVAVMANGIAGAVWSVASSPLRMVTVARDNATVTQPLGITGNAPAMIAASTTDELQRFLVVSVTPEQLIRKTLLDDSGTEIPSPTPVIYPAYANLTPLSLKWSQSDHRFVLVYASENGLRIHRCDASFAETHTDEPLSSSPAEGAAGIAALENHYVIGDQSQLAAYCPLRVDVDKTSLSVALNTTVTFAANGQNGVGPYRYQWLFYDDNGVAETQTAAHKFSTTGVWLAAATAFDANGNWEERLVEVTVVPVRRRAGR